MTNKKPKEFPYPGNRAAIDWINSRTGISKRNINVVLRCLPEFFAANISKDRKVRVCDLVGAILVRRSGREKARWGEGYRIKWETARYLIERVQDPPAKSKAIYKTRQRSASVASSCVVCGEMTRNQINFHGKWTPWCGCGDKPGKQSADDQKPNNQTNIA